MEDGVDHTHDFMELTYVLSGKGKYIIEGEEYIVSGEMEKAHDLQAKILFFIYRLCSFPSMYGANKAIISLRSGIEIGQPRLPFLPVSREDPKLIELKEDIERAIAELK